VSTYAVDSKRQSMKSTGIVEEVKEWEERDGKRRPSEVQARDEDTGMPLWSVEVAYRQSAWGREQTVTGRVVVGMPVKPVLGEYVAVTFVDLRVTVRVNQAGGLVETWEADRLTDDKPASAAPSGPAASSTKAA